MSILYFDTPTFFKPWIQSELLIRLDFSPAVALLGTRQVGKTTLAYEISRQRDSIYLDLGSVT
jgi:predicted AAA+ superfamily ATPase